VPDFDEYDGVELVRVPSSSETTQSAVMRSSAIVRTSMVRISTGQPVGATVPIGMSNAPTRRPRKRKTITSLSGVSTWSTISAVRPAKLRCKERARSTRAVTGVRHAVGRNRIGVKLAERRLGIGALIDRLLPEVEQSVQQGDHDLMCTPPAPLRCAVAVATTG
jgi:hypothetical protein